MIPRIRTWAIVLLLCVALVPLCVFFGGLLLVGPYDDETGVFGLMGQIYGDALNGSASAWFLLLSPMLLFGIWSFCWWLQTRLVQQQDHPVAQSN